MSGSINRMFGFVALAGLMGVCTAQAAVQARFHLPVAAHWGTTLLAPGDYKLFVTDPSAGHNQVIVQGQGHTIYEMPLAADPQDISDSSSLQLVEQDGAYFVREYRSGFSGKVYTFGLPKHLTSHSTKSVEIAN